MTLTQLKKAIAYAVFCGFFTGIAAGISALAAPGPYKLVKLEKALLWEISGKGLTKPSYLYGTIHAICPADFVMTETIKAKVKSADQIALEFDFDDPNMGREMMQHVVMKDGTTLKGLLSEADYQKLSNYFSQQVGADIKMLETWKPMMLAGLLMTKMMDCKPESYEAAFMKMAQEQKKELIGVETIAEQLAAFDKIPYPEQATILVQSIDDIDKAKGTLKQMTVMYQQQDLEGFQKLFKESSQAMKNFEEVLLVQRNLRWIPVIEREAKEMPTFFAVGAGHLGGDQGVIALLRKQGYTVKPVK